jgi:hypothetical protein
LIPFSIWISGIFIAGPPVIARLEEPWQRGLATHKLLACRDGSDDSDLLKIVVI